MELEIENSEAYLKGLPKEGGFTVPSSYFNELEEKLQNFAAEEELLLGINIHENFDVPAGYFDQLNERIMAGIGEAKNVVELETEKKGKIISLFGRPIVMRIIGVAASAILVSGLYFFQPKPMDSEISAKEEIGINEVADHLDATELDEELLCDAGWCNELEGLYPDKNQKGDESYLELEEELIIDEL